MDYIPNDFWGYYPLAERGGIHRHAKTASASEKAKAKRSDDGAANRVVAEMMNVGHATIAAAAKVKKEAKAF